MNDPQLPSSPPSPLASAGASLTVWVLRSIFATVAVALAIVGFLFLAPIVAILIALALVTVVIAWARSWTSRQRAPGGFFDQRKNVRVVKREQ